MENLKYNETKTTSRMEELKAAFYVAFHTLFQC